MYRASVVILNWNGVSFLKKYLPILVEHTAYSVVELVVADNNSNDGSQEYIRKAFPNVRLIEFSENHGFAGGYNLAFQQIEAKYFVLLNSDVEVTANWLNPLLDFLDFNVDTAAVMPKLRSVHDKTAFEYAGAAGGFIDIFGYPFCRGRIFDKIEKDLGQYDSNREVFWATGACLVIRSEVYHKVGGLDEHFFAHMEEIDLCWRVHWAGYKIFCIPEAMVYHVGGGALPKENPRKNYLNFRNSLFLLLKNLPVAYIIPILFSRLALDMLAFLQFLSKRKPAFAFSIIKAWINFIYKSPFYIKYRFETRKLKVSKNWKEVMLFKSVVFLFFLKKKHAFNQIIR